MYSDCFAVGFEIISLALPDIIKNEVPEDKVYDFTEKPEDAIRVMSFNIRCTNVGLRGRISRTDDVVNTIISGMPDSFGVQEATPS